MKADVIKARWAAMLKKHPKIAGITGIRQKLLLGFLIFTAVILIILWVFQILLLNPFYESIKNSEAETAADTLKKALDTGDDNNLRNVAEELANRNSLSVRVANQYGRDCFEFEYRTTIGSSTTVIVSPANKYIIWSYSQARLMNIYKDVADLGGYLKEVDNSGLANSPPSTQKQKRLLMAVTYTTVYNESYLILVESELTPLDATVDTLKVQLICLSIVMLILGVGLALFIARKLSQPIVSINESAKLLAKGDYGIKFPEKGSKEVLELAQTLNYAAVELSKVEKLRRELIANVSHDLRTPLTMIKGYSEVMRDLPGENSPENVQVIIDEATRLTDLVNDMLDLSKLEAGAENIDLYKFNLTMSIRDILHRYDKLADYRFDFFYDQDVYVYADELKISQVVYNLVNNAINYAGADKRITLRQTIRDNMVCIEVSDTGEGIPEDKLKDIWHRYYKVDKEHKRAQVGTGLGLSIVKNVLDTHGGKYGVRSTLGEGSTFWFELPLDHEEPREALEI